MMQSDDDSRRIAAIGAPPGKILVTGNIKFDKSLAEEKTDEEIARDLEAGFCPAGFNAPLIVAGSTHRGEEEILIEVLRRIRTYPQLGGTRLLLAPRHPERFNEATESILGSGFTVRRRTDGSGQENASDIFLLDTLGELSAAYHLATVTFVGGSLIRHGGHSIMEPALYAKAIVIGPFTENFRGIVEEFRTQNAIRQISAGDTDRDLQVEQLTRAFADLLQNVNEREALGRAAFSILEKNRGAARITADQIASIFEETRE